MSQLERTIKDLIIFYVKENYNNYLKENNLSFIHGDKLYPVKPTDFLLFDPKIDHKADDILVDKKRLAIDFTVRAK